MKNKFIISFLAGALIFVATGCTKESSNAVLPLTDEEHAAAVDETRSVVELYFVALEDAGDSGEVIGCDDSVVSVLAPGSGTENTPEFALQLLLDEKDEYYGQSGLYNALHQSDLDIEDVSVEGGVATVNLTGDVVLSGTCDTPRVSAQIRNTLLQFDSIDEVVVYLDGELLEVALSAQGQ